LAADGTVTHNCKEIACNIEFRDNAGNTYINQTFLDDSIDDKYGVFVHTDCWNFIKQEYNIHLSYKYLPINKVPVTEKKMFSFIHYQIEKYWTQEFDFIKMISDGNEELSSSPLTSEIVGKNIKNVFTKLKIRDDPNRKSPLVSATFYKPGMYRIGNNGNIWMIKGNKWVELKDTIIRVINDIKVIKEMIFLYDINVLPIFVSKIAGKNITIVTTEEFASKKLKDKLH
jgi:hypothetical protein